MAVTIVDLVGLFEALHVDVSLIWFHGCLTRKDTSVLKESYCFFSSLFNSLCKLNLVDGKFMTEDKQACIELPCFLNYS